MTLCGKFRRFHIVINLSRQGLTKTNIPGQPLMSICSGLDRLTRASFLLQHVEGTSPSNVSAKSGPRTTRGVAKWVSQAVAHAAVIQHYQCWTVCSLSATSSAQKSGKTDHFSRSKRRKKGTAQAGSLQHIISKLQADPRLPDCTKKKSGSFTLNTVLAPA